MSLLSWATDTAPQSEQDAQFAAKQAELARRQAAREAAGNPVPTYVAEQNNALLQTSTESEAQAYGEGFVEGAKEGLNNVLNAPGWLTKVIGDGASQVLWGVIKNIPWWVWPVALLVLFFYMGGGVLLRGRLARR